MHELSIVQSLINQALDIQKKVTPEKIKTVYLDVGELSGVEAFSLEFYYKELIKNSFLENTNLIVRRCELKGQCQDCRVQFKMKELALTCPNCLSQNVTLIGGRELMITGVDLIGDDLPNKEGSAKV